MMGPRTEFDGCRSRLVHDIVEHMQEEPLLWETHRQITQEARWAKHSGMSPRDTEVGCRFEADGLYCSFVKNHC